MSTLTLWHLSSQPRHPNTPVRNPPLTPTSNWLLSEGQTPFCLFFLSCTSQDSPAGPGCTGVLPQLLCQRGAGHTAATQTRPRRVGMCFLQAAAGCCNNKRAADSGFNFRTKAGKKGGARLSHSRPQPHRCFPGLARPARSRPNSHTAAQRRTGGGERRPGGSGRWEPL